ncbi:hypothetical protein QE359_003696 [Curtobacterium sp. SORGH_AS776]|nr:hypothetical protein [Curtobacterium sp. SORGH_AS_0776]
MSATRKKRRDMTKYERAVDWRDRLSPRWWRAVWVIFGLSGALYVLGAVLRISGI